MRVAGRWSLLPSWKKPVSWPWHNPASPSGSAPLSPFPSWPSVSGPLIAARTKPDGRPVPRLSYPDQHPRPRRERSEQVFQHGRRTSASERRGEATDRRCALSASKVFDMPHTVKPELPSQPRQHRPLSNPTAASPRHPSVVLRRPRSSSVLKILSYEIINSKKPISIANQNTLLTHTRRSPT